MARLAQGCALLAVLAALLIPSTAVATTTITTVAGGGTQPFGYPPTIQAPLATDAALGSPTGIAYTRFPANGYGPNSIWVMPQDGSCVLTELQNSKLMVEAGNMNGCDPPNAAYSPGGSIPWTSSIVMRFNHPCCVASWQFNNGTAALIASSDAGRVELVFPNSGGFSLAGSSLATGCGTASPAAVSDSPTTAFNAHFCTLTALATLPDPNAGSLSSGNGVYAIGEGIRANAGSLNDHGHVYYVTTDGVIHHITGQYHVAGQAFAPNGDILVADGLDAILRISNLLSTPSVEVIAGRYFPATDTYFTGYAGDGDSGANVYFNHPTALTVGYDGAVYVADSLNCRIRKLSDASSSGVASTIAGTGCGAASAPFGDGGPSTGASLDTPGGVSMAPAGLFISDTGHNRVRLIDRTSIVSAPPAITGDATPEFEFSSLDTPAHFKCTLDGGAPFDCPTPYTFDTLPDGLHTLNAWENGPPADPTPSVATFTVDTAPPTDLALKSPAAGATDPAPQPSFSWAEAHDLTSAVDHYELWIDGAKDSDVHTSSCKDAVCTAKPTKAMDEKAHKWQVRAVDQAGNSAQTEERDLTVGGPPTASLLINPNPALIGRAVTFDASASSDPSGIAKYEWDLDGDGKFERDTGTTATTTRTFDAPATVPVTLRVTDGAGTTSTTTTQLKITQPGSAASLLGISINSGAQYTNDPNVKLLVKAPATANSILVSNDGGFLAPSTFPVSTSVDWKLDSSGPERLPKTVYARFLLGPIISETYTDDIILDEIPPVVQQADLTAVPNQLQQQLQQKPGKTSRIAKVGVYVVKVKAKDSNSGVSQVQVTANKKKPGKLLAYKKKLTVKSGTRPKFIRARDRAGNFSHWKKLR